jgi:serine protease AprX
VVNVGRMKRAGAWMAAVGLGVMQVGGPTPAAGTGAHGPAGNWASWLGSATADAPTTLKQVRTLIGAHTGTAATLTGKGVGVALIDTRRRAGRRSPGEPDRERS